MAQHGRRRPSLTGQQGVESFRDAWKDLGTDLFEAAKDPYGTAARIVIDDAEAARANPEYWLGGKTDAFLPAPM